MVKHSLSFSAELYIFTTLVLKEGETLLNLCGDEARVWDGEAVVVAASDVNHPDSLKVLQKARLGIYGVW